MAVRKTNHEPVYCDRIGLINIGVFFIQHPHFELDASSDTLLLEDDEDLRYYRNIKARYGDDEFLVVTISPQGDLFEEKNIDLLIDLKTELSTRAD